MSANNICKQLLLHEIDGNEIFFYDFKLCISKTFKSSSCSTAFYVDFHFLKLVETKIDFNP